MSRYLTLANGVRQWARAITSSTGATDAAKLICTNSRGAIDESLLPGLPIGSPEGLTLSRNSTLPDTQLDIAAGRAIVAAGSDRYVAINGSAMTKRLDAACATGSGSGGLFSGTVAANTTYHVFILRRSSDGAIDFGFDTSASAANAPSGWSARMIGSIRTEANAFIRAFFQVGDRFEWASPPSDLSGATASTVTTNLQALTVPTGIRVRVLGIFDVANGSSTGGLFGGAPDGTATQRAFVGATNVQIRTPFEIVTNTSGQIRLYSPVSNMSLSVITQGFMHPRGAWS